jgi:YgiT-type zinc finger domain-containing protein
MRPRLEWPPVQRLRLEERGDALGGTPSCVRCGGALERARRIERLVREGDHAALVEVRADLCPLCGEMLLAPGMAGLLLDARDTLRAGRAGWAIGCVYDLRRRGV